MRKKDAATDGASAWSSAPPGRVTPLDVQQKEFHVTRVGAGYRMREVDEFLDQVTETLSALIAENERLLRDSSGPQAAPSAQPNPSAMSGEDADRVAVEAFLRREKGFLQDLGGLVQAHAEELRTMVKEVRRVAPPSAVPDEPARMEPVAEEPEEPPGASDEAARAASGEEATEASSDPADDAAGEAAGEAAAAMEPASGAAEGPDEPVPNDEGEHLPMTTTEVVADEPIRLEEPQPARSRRSDKDEGDSLRELFWGEEE
jgi:DivIVA domain-containing protein